MFLQRAQQCLVWQHGHFNMPGMTYDTMTFYTALTCIHTVDPGSRACTTIKLMVAAASGKQSSTTPATTPACLYVQ